MFRALRNKLVGHYLLPRFIRAGWRNADYIPLNDLTLTPQFGFDEEAEIKKAVPLVRNHALSSFERMATLWQQVRYLDRCGIPGALIECGTYRGGSVGMMALAHKRSNPTPVRELHLFDSFEGLPEPKANIDGTRAVEFTEGRSSGALQTTGKCVGTLDVNQDLLERTIGYPRELIHYHVGWFQDTLPQDAPNVGPIALLRLDGDWYDSTRLPLEHLYEKVVRGGVVVIDDYGHFEGAKKAVDEFLASRSEPILLNHIDYTGRFWVKI